MKQNLLDYQLKLETQTKEYFNNIPGDFHPTKIANATIAKFLYEKLKRITDDLKLRLVRLTWFYILGMAVFITLFVLVGVPIIMRLFIGGEYAGIEPLILWIAIGYGFNGIYKMLVNYLVF